jgi:5' nucleotidase family
VVASEHASGFWGQQQPESMQPEAHQTVLKHSVDRFFVRQAIANLKSQRDQVRESHRSMLQRHHESFHSTWGQLTKTGYSNSRFAHQVGC